VSCEFVYQWSCSNEHTKERMVDTEPPLSRAVALFGLYTFYVTQPCTDAPSLHSNEHIEIPIGR
jgi:hypothetical protein